MGAEACDSSRPADISAAPFYTFRVSSLPYLALRMLADGRFCSGADIARAAGVSRASVWLAVRELERAGLEVLKVRGRGYCLSQAVSVLDAAAIAHHLGRDAGRFALEILDHVESTNTLLMQRASTGAPGGTVIVAEHQSAGRGRLGRPWYASVGGALTFSLLWRVASGAAALAGLSLATGIAVARAFEGLGVAGATLKWPNDLVWRGAKLAGILIEMQGDALGPSHAVIGIGVNVRMSDSVRAGIDQPVTDLESACGCPLDRNVVLARLLAELDRVLVAFERDGFGALAGEWQQRHAYQGCSVNLTLPDGTVYSGIARGVAADGALLLERATRLERFHAGEVGLRGDRA
jgi:BirA family biotin operon repressor/biotin-[acetyl-CoA-carboxylase] ligase